MFVLFGKRLLTFSEYSLKIEICNIALSSLYSTILWLTLTGLIKIGRYTSLITK